MGKTEDDKFFVEWNNHWVYRESMKNFLKSEAFSDVSVEVKDGSFKCHKIILAACSSYFEDLLISNTSSTISFPDITKSQLKPILDFLYEGNVTVNANQVESFIKLALKLQIRGVTEDHKVEKPPKKHEEHLSTSRTSTCYKPTLSGGNIHSGSRSRRKQVLKPIDVYDFDEESEDSVSDFKNPPTSKKRSKLSYSARIPKVSVDWKPHHVILYFKNILSYHRTLEFQNAVLNHLGSQVSESVIWNH